VTERFASLPMYDLPELRADTDVLWRDIAGHLAFADVPEVLARDHADDLLTHHWRNPGLLLSQACGWPVAALLNRKVAVVGAFTYAGVSDASARYASHLVVRADDTHRPLPGRPVAVNSTDSLSGWISLIAAVGELGPVLVTGAHVESLAAVRERRADLAAIDSVTWALLARYRPAALDGLTIVGEGPLIPCVPLITHPALGPGVDVLRTALADVRSEPLLIDGFVSLDASDYAAVLALSPSTDAPIHRPQPSV
jgi:ABC-type phosphate/phosphonate transport system substrate-binding protein